MIAILKMFFLSLTLWRRAIAVTLSMQSFVYDLHTITSTEEAFLENLGEMFPRRYMDKDVCNMLKSSTTPLFCHPSWKG